MINRQWHAGHKMPKRPSLKERVDWHREHAVYCTCRAMPKSIKSLIPYESESPFYLTDK